MPSVILNKKVFEKLVGKSLPLDELKDRISMLGTDLEGIEGNEINVEIFPNRPDMLSEQGFARAFSSFIGSKTGLRKYDVDNSGEKVIIDKSVAKVRPYTACAIVKNLKFDDEKIKEIIQIQEKLHISYGRKRKKVAIGIYPFEKIKPPITFSAKKPENIIFRPLEYPKEINARKILSQHPAGREYGHLLEGMEKFPVFTDSDGKVLSLPPIINSHDTGKISENTTEIFIECSGFDFEVLHKCINIIVTALNDMGGKICSMELEYPDKKIHTPNLEPSKMDLNLDYVNKRLGIDIKEKEIKDLLEKMGYGYENKKVLVPAYRADILHQIDLIEDIAIAYGYENFGEIIPQVATIAEESRIDIIKDKITEIIAGMGMIEVNTFNLTSMEEQNKKMESNLKVIELANSLSEDFNVLRGWIIPSLMDVLKNNKHHYYPQEIFGFGTVFKRNDKLETGIEENERLCVMVSDDKADFTRIKQILDYIMRSVGVEYDIDETDHPSFIPGRVGRLSVKGKNLAFVGEISPKVLENWKLENPVVTFELNITELLDVIDY